MYNLLSKYDNYKIVFNKFTESDDFKKSLYECQCKFPTLKKGKTDTSKATDEIFSCLENWIFDLSDENITDLECMAFMDSYGARLHTNIRDYIIKLDSEATLSQAIN